MKFRNLLLSLAIITQPVLYAYDQFDLADALYRIEKYINLIDQFSRNNKKLHYSLVVKNNSICPEHRCDHALTKLCIKKMANEPNVLGAVVETWHLFKRSFANIETELFVKEFSSILHAVYQYSVSLLSKSAHSNPQNHPLSFEEIIILYNKISSLPIIQIIASLEQLYVALKAIMLEYGIKPDTNWTEWIKNNWWIPPVIIGSVIYTVSQRQALKKMIAQRFSPIQELKSSY